MSYCYVLFWMRPVILGLTGSEAITMRAQIDAQIDREETLLSRLPDEAQALLFDQMALLRTLRDKLDAAMTVRESVIKVPF